MKKLLALGLFCAIMVSCRKTRTCECVTTNQVNAEQLTTATEFYTTKPKAESLCNDLNRNQGDFKTECILK
jgi:hypothetical protein